VSPQILLLIILTECLAVTGQILFKKAMGGENLRKNILVTGIAVMGANFFLWKWLLGQFPLSYIYPFDSLNRILLLVAAAIFLKEKMTPTLWAGVGLVCAGVLLVASS
jgi:uncharacterized membrane protein